MSRRTTAASPLTTAPPGAAVARPEPADRPPGGPHHPGYTGCYGCAPDHAEGLRLRAVSADAAGLTAVVAVGECQQGAPGLAHGGVLAAVMDEVTGMAAWRLGRHYVTGRLETDYLRPVPVGSVLHVRAVHTGVHGRKAYLEAEARIGCADGPVAVRAAALYVAVPDTPRTAPTGSIVDG